MLGVAVVLVVVLGGLVAFLVSERMTRPTEPAAASELPEGVAEVLDVLRSAAIIVDVADDVVRATPAAFRLGLVRERQLVHPQVMTLVRAARREGLIVERELELRRGPIGQGVVYVQVRVAPLGSLHVLVLAEDRTESRRVEEVRRDFAVNVSHELKTPVGAIALLAETLQEAADDPEAVRRFAERTRWEADRLSVLIQEIIDLSRVQSAPDMESPELVDMAEVVSEAVDQAQLAAASSQISIDVHADSTDLQVTGEKAMLITVLRNLVDNAIRYSEPQTHIDIDLKREDQLIVVTVRDQGIGIATDDLDRVFERFFRVDPARSRATGGTGLGLSIVKHVIGNHGGDVQVTSELGRGSTFALRLPAAHRLLSVTEQELAPTPAEPTSRVSSWGRGRRESGRRERRSGDPHPGG